MQVHHNGFCSNLTICLAQVGIKELQTNAQGIEAHFATNHLGHFLLTGLLLDLLKKSNSARIVTVSSAGYKMAEKWDWKKIENPTGTITSLLYIKLTSVRI